MFIPAENVRFKVYLSLGSNIDPIYNIPKAINYLKTLVSINVISNFWETAPVGNDGKCFINAALLIYTNYSLDYFKQKIIRKIEADLGRIRTENKYDPRPIDIDIIIVNN
ncbi:MAG TPA: 2-amino-4-hydroxy-6-hydroxymethyldihydropteridine diphosphokinase [Anaerolineae bacterium]|nr:2-amino-4-hydroxy-6-hydroxymethyldihydropteridine diphosphokinase [Anaerolineae bacterium]